MPDPYAASQLPSLFLKKLLVPRSISGVDSLVQGCLMRLVPVLNWRARVLHNTAVCQPSVTLLHIH